MSKLTDVTLHNYETDIKNSDKPVVIDVYASWCGPCQHMEPYFKELSEQYGDKYRFAKLNVEEAGEIASQFGIMSVPTFLFMKKGALVGQEVGYMTKEELETKIKQYLG